MSACDDYCDVPRAYTYINNCSNESTMLSPTSYSYHGPGRSEQRTAVIKPEPTSPPILTVVKPCLPPEAEMSTVHNPHQNQIPLTSEIMRHSQRDDADADKGNAKTSEVQGPSFPKTSHVDPVGPTLPKISQAVGPTLPSFGHWPYPTLLQNPHKPDQEMEVVQELMTEGVIKYGLPMCAAAVAGTFLMRRRYKQFKATPVENFLLSALHYYGAAMLGMYTGLTLYTPQLEAKLQERIPDSSVARALKEGKNRYK